MNKMNVLYIEDNQIYRVIVEKTLEHDYTIDLASSVKEGLEKGLKNDYDIIIIDLNLNDPEVYGFNVLVELKKRLKGKKRAYIAHTNYTGPEWESKCLDIGFDAFMTKPIDLTLFNEFVQNHFK
jgi:two-component system cell cycle response regulator DivK